LTAGKTGRGVEAMAESMSETNNAYLEALKQMIATLAKAADSMLKFRAEIERLHETREYRQFDIYDRYLAPDRSEN
jgi:hypothetical protein